MIIINGLIIRINNCSIKTSLQTSDKAELQKSFLPNISLRKSINHAVILKKVHASIGDKQMQSKMKASHSKKGLRLFSSEYNK